MCVPVRKVSCPAHPRVYMERLQWLVPPGFSGNPVSAPCPWQWIVSLLSVFLKELIFPFYATDHKLRDRKGSMMVQMCESVCGARDTKGHFNRMPVIQWESLSSFQRYNAYFGCKHKSVALQPTGLQHQCLFFFLSQVNAKACDLKATHRAACRPVPNSNIHMHCACWERLHHPAGLLLSPPQRGDWSTV